MMQTETKLTVEEFNAKYAHIKEQHEAKQEKVNAYLDQSFASLFAKSGWSQQEIADEVGLKQPYVSQLLCFGKFLAFIAASNNRTICPDLTEFKFRKHWGETVGEGKDETRFHLVMKKLIECGDVKDDTLKAKIAKVCEEFASRKEIAERVGCTDQQVIDTLGHLRKVSQYIVEDNRGSKGCRKYRIRRAGRKIDYDVLMERLNECFLDLDRQGSVDSMAEYAPSVIKAASFKIKQIIRELAGVDVRKKKR